MTTIQLQRHILPDQNEFLTGCLPEELVPSEEQFECFWRLHPVEYSRRMIHGRLKPMPRWDAAYEREYKFNAVPAKAQACPEVLRPYLTWAQQLDPRINGLFLNWYDGEHRHYMGKHHDNHRQLVPGSPILMISLGAPRIFRLTQADKEVNRKCDLMTGHGSVIVLPWQANRNWKHEVLQRRKQGGRRISITARAFAAPVN